MSSNEELAIMAKSGDKQATATLWEQVKGVCYTLSFRFMNKYLPRCRSCGITQDDLIQECFLALSEAVQAYKTESGYKFTSYLGTYVKKRFFVLCGYRTERMKNEPINAAQSLHDTLPGSEDVTLMDTLTDETAQEDFETVIEREYIRELHGALDEAMNTALTPEQEQVIRLYYYGGQSFNKIGEASGKSFQRARQINQEALRKLRNPKHSKRLRTFCEHSGWFYSGGLSSFRANQGSCVELLIESLEESLQKERERFGCTLHELNRLNEISRRSNKGGKFGFNDSDI